MLNESLLSREGMWSGGVQTDYWPAVGERPLSSVLTQKTDYPNSLLVESALSR
jgi:hypothetical protein